MEIFWLRLSKVGVGAIVLDGDYAKAAARLAAAIFKDLVFTVIFFPSVLLRTTSLAREPSQEGQSLYTEM